MRRALLLCLTLLFAGCLGEPTDGAPAGEPAPEPPAQVELVYRTTEHMTLTTADVPEGRVVVPWSHAQQLTDVPAPEWLADVGGWHVTAAWADVTYEVPRAAVGTQFRGGDMTVWWGSSQSVVSHKTPASEAVFVSGQQYRLDNVSLEVPVGGLFIPADEPARLMVAGYLATDLLDSFEVITGEATTLRIIATPWNATVPEWTEQQVWSGGVQNCVSGEPRSIYYDVAVENTSQPLRFTIDKTGGQGHPDLDLYLYGPDGNWVARAHGPGPAETIDLWPAQMEQGPGTYQARVVWVCAGTVSYDLRMLA